MTKRRENQVEIDGYKKDDKIRRNNMGATLPKKKGNVVSNLGHPFMVDVASKKNGVYR